MERKSTEQKMFKQVFSSQKTKHTQWWKSYNIKQDTLKESLKQFMPRLQVSHANKKINCTGKLDRDW